MSEVQLTPFVRGIERDVEDVAQEVGGLRDAIGVTIDSVGGLSGIFLGPPRVFFDGSPTRCIQWGTRTVKLADVQGNPMQISGISTNTPSDNDVVMDGKAVVHTKYLAVGGNGQAKILINSSVTNPFTDSFCFIGEGIGDDFGDFTHTQITPTLQRLDFNVSIFPQVQSGKTPRYVLFNNDADSGSVTATKRLINQGTITTVGSDVTRVEYVGGPPPAGATYAYLIFGSSDTGTWNVGGFFHWMDRLCAWDGNRVLVSGFPGFPSPFVAPNPDDWAYWYSLNYKQVGHPDDEAENNILRCVVVGGLVMVFLERGIAIISGTPPVNELENQMVVDFLSNTLGAKSYDAITVAPDGQSVFFVGIDGNLYVASPSGIQEISKKIRKHERFRDFEYVVAAENVVVFSGGSYDYNLVTREWQNLPSGYFMQFPSSFMYNTETQAWSEFILLGLDEQYGIVPFDDPDNAGGFFLHTVNNKNCVAYGAYGGIRVLQDPDYGYTDINNVLCIGGATHQLEFGSSVLKRVDCVNVQVDTPLVDKLSVISPAKDPAGISPADVSRATYRRKIGNNRSYELFMRRGLMSNSVSVAFGLWGDKLVYGANFVPDTGFPIVNPTGLSQMVYIDDTVSRIDFLCKDVTDLTIKIYENEEVAAGDSIGDLVFSSTLTAPKTGHKISSNWYWRTSEIKYKFDTGKYWVRIEGISTIASYQSGMQIVDDAHTPSVPSVIYDYRSFGMRIIRELGAPFAAKKILGISTVFQTIGNSKW